MARELQDRVLAVLEQATRPKVYAGPTQDWLQRPGREEWPAVAAHPAAPRPA